MVIRLRGYSLLILFVALSLIGLVLIPRLSVQLAPPVGGRSLTLSYTWPGAAPEAMEQPPARLEGKRSATK